MREIENFTLLIKFSALTTTGITKSRDEFQKSFEKSQLTSRKLKKFFPKLKKTANALSYTESELYVANEG